MKVIKAKPTAEVEKHRAAVLAFIERQSGDVEFSAVRAAFPAAVRQEMTDGLIHQICLDAGLTVEP